VAELEQLSRRELLAVVIAQAELIQQQEARIAAQDNRIAELIAQVEELTRRLGQNSGNSSLPPSSDRFAKPKRQRRKASGRKPGKQPGAGGATLELVAHPDEVIDHEPGACRGCGAVLDGAEPAGVIVRQVRDVPLVKIRVVEHRLHKRACSCGAVTTASSSYLRILVAQSM
jgi:transposase